jgi:uncharacterized protein (UPF0332 family)
MDPQEMNRRWETAREHLKAASVCNDQGLYRSSVTRSYYGAYQAMWVALGDPTTGQWRHGGAIDAFCYGQWATPVIIPTALAPLRKRLLNLYELRLAGDYRAIVVTAQESINGINTAFEVLQLVAQQKGLTM